MTIALVQKALVDGYWLHHNFLGRMIWIMNGLKGTFLGKLCDLWCFLTGFVIAWFFLKNKTQSCFWSFFSPRYKCCKRCSGSPDLWIWYLKTCDGIFMYTSLGRSPIEPRSIYFWTNMHRLHWLRCVMFLNKQLYYGISASVSQQACRHLCDYAVCCVFRTMAQASADDDYELAIFEKEIKDIWAKFRTTCCGEFIEQTQGLRDGCHESINKLTGMMLFDGFFAMSLLSGPSCHKDRGHHS